jgi:SAM-dependent methyltransferase
MTEEIEENGDNDDYDPLEVYGRDIRQMLLINEVISTSFKDKKNITIIDVGVQNSASCLIYAIINSNITKVIGIDSEPAGPPWNDLQLWKRLASDGTTIEYIEGNIFSEVDMELLEEYHENKVDLCFNHQTLHHLRLNNCKFRDEEKCSIMDQKCSIQECESAVGTFTPPIIINTLMTYSDSILISEDYYVDEDIDKEDSMGGYLDLKELNEMFKYLLSNYNIVFYRPFRKKYVKSSNKKTKISNLAEIMEKIQMVDNFACLIVNDLR